MKDLIKKYNITETANGMIQARPAHKLTDAEKDQIRAAKPAILAYFAELRQAEADRQAKIEAIEGLEELKDIRAEWENYRDEFDQAMEAGNGYTPSKPEEKVEDVAKRYPRAAAYLKAEDYSYASHYAKASAGRKALERIINGENHEQAIAEMEAEFTAYCEKHIWD